MATGIQEDKSEHRDEVVRADSSLGLQEIQSNTICHKSAIADPQVKTSKSLHEETLIQPSL